ncbi:tetratricopeptide repeat protein [Pelagicoccus albus]|uniref:DUF4034 domain-containing protein n=1 Tax=Pelagicoccus albus TaxID=415222 RepID=A0A7X1B9C0_9BACT|nr:hypothetical protein [Pelagicoccus albus]MBC2608048.1 hypothetical protein [Pelagicoccus albus]
MNKQLKMTFEPFRFMLVVFLCVFAAPSCFAKGEPLDVFELDPVKSMGSFELPDEEEWSYGQLDEFEVLSNASEINTKKLLSDFGRFRDALNFVLPIRPTPKANARLILCGSKGEFWRFTERVGESRNGVFSLLLQNDSQLAIVLNMQSRYYNTRIDTEPVSLEIDYRRQLFREYAKFLLAKDKKLPPWLLEGWLQIVMDIELYDRIIKFGQLDMDRGIPDPNAIPRGGNFDSVYEALVFAGVISETAAEEGEDEMLTAAPVQAEEMDAVPLDAVLEFWTQDPPFHIALAKQILIPLQEMFSYPIEEYEELNRLTDLLWAKQCHVFVHFCNYASRGKYKQSFDLFVERLKTEEPSEELFEECFDMSYRQMTKKFEAHIRYPYHNYQYVKLNKDQPLAYPEVELRSASQSEIGRIKGDVQLLAGLTDRAVLSYKVALKRDTNNPQLLAAYGLGEYQAGNQEKAYDLLLKATSNGVNRAEVWVALADITLTKALKSPNENGQLSAEQMQAILLPLLKARSLPPALPQTYKLMAKAWDHSSIRPNAIQVELLSEGVLAFTEASELALSTAHFYEMLADIDHARQAARIGLKNVRDPKLREQFERILSETKVVR